MNSQLSGVNMKNRSSINSTKQTSHEIYEDDEINMDIQTQKKIINQMTKDLVSRIDELTRQNNMQQMTIKRYRQLMNENLYTTPQGEPKFKRQDTSVTFQDYNSIVEDRNSQITKINPRLNVVSESVADSHILLKEHSIYDDKLKFSGL